METLHFGSDLVLPLATMGIVSSQEELVFRTTSPLPLTEMEAALRVALDTQVVLKSEGGEELRVYDGYTQLTALGKELVEGEWVTEVSLHKPSQLEKRVSLLEDAVAEMGELMGGEV